MMHCGKYRRLGGAYLLVLGTATVVGLIGFAALACMRLQQRGSRDLSDCAAARACAQSAIELGLHVIKTDPNWRDRPNGAWLTNRSLGNGKLSLTVVDSQEDAVVLTGDGTQGQARHRTSVRVDAVKTPWSCLEVSLHAGGNISFGSATVQGDQVVSSNGNVSAYLGDIYPQVEALGTIGGHTYRGSTNTMSAARTLPDAKVFDYYKTNGTWISVSALPLSGSVRQIAQKVLSPASNPFGSETNAQGIYVIDCQANSVVISQSRIVGTLVLLNPGSGSAVQGSVNWTPVVQNYPCLLVQGDLSLKFSSSALTESGTNFNPTGTPYPYPDGDTDKDGTDSYPSLISGLVYVSGSVSTLNSPAVGVLAVGGTLSCSGTLNLTYDSLYLFNPPPGFYSFVMTPDPQSWKQVVD